ncbi:MAG: hypothetical protein M4D80_42265, partial [Myxococcota bacterium]|nr:hypothetical protein [Myxococcota bacterium]
MLYCAIHEWLVEVPYALTRQIQIGDVYREEVVWMRCSPPTRWQLIAPLIERLSMKQEPSSMPQNIATRS